MGRRCSPGNLPITFQDDHFPFFPRSIPAGDIDHGPDQGTNHSVEESIGRDPEASSSRSSVHRDSDTRQIPCSVSAATLANDVKSCSPITFAAQRFSSSRSRR